MAMNQPLNCQKTATIYVMSSNRRSQVSQHSVRLLRAHPRTKPFIIVVTFVLVGVSLLVFSQAATPTTSLEPEDASLSGVSIVQDQQASGNQFVRFTAPGSASRRFFADSASWNQTVSQMGGEEQALLPFAQRYYDYAAGVNNGPSPVKTRLSLADYSVPIYDMQQATTQAKVFQSSAVSSQITLSRSGVQNGDTIPWKPTWKPGTGNDAIMHIVNYDTGEAYELWLVNQSEPNCAGYILFGQFQTGKDLCLGAVEHYNNLWTADDTSTIVGRGMGINNLALVTRADEVASGTIAHALSLTISNAMFGPTMIDPQDEPTQNLSEAGITKGFFLRPATRLEHRCSNNSKLAIDPSIQLDATYRAKTIPSGLRVAARITEADITTWLDSKGYTGAKRQTAAIFARAWRDYGGIVAETGGANVTIETDGVIGPAKQKWADLGLYNTATDQTSNLDFSGLLTRDNIYVVQPPARLTPMGVQATRPC